MKSHAIQIVARETATLIEVDTPLVSEPGMVSGKTIVSLVSPGTELAWNYTGEQFPSFPGYAAVFRVEQVGEGVKTVAVGDRAFCMGSHRAFQSHKENSIVRVPDTLAPEVAVLTRLAGVSMTTLMTTTARPGDVAMVVGMGPVGFLCAQMLKIAGYVVIAVEPDEKRLAAITAMGMDLSLPSVPDESGPYTGKIALVVDCSGHEAAVVKACKLVRRKGEIVLVGVPWKRNAEIYAHDLLHVIFLKYAIVRSGWEWEIPSQTSDYSEHSMFKNYATAMGWLADGRLRAGEQIQTFHPKDAQDVYQSLLHKTASGLFCEFDWRQTES